MRQISMRKPTSDNPSAGIFEKVRCAARDAREECEDRERNRRHRRILCAARDDFMRDVIMHMLHVGGEPQHLTILERQRDVRCLHEAEPDVDVIDAVAEAFDLVAFAERNARPPVRR